MGVVKGSGSMSSTTDVIYTHKKFKKAVAETWEKKEEKVFGRQIEVSSESDTFLCRDRCLSNTTCIDLRVPQKENGESNILSDSYATNTSILTSESLKRCHQNDVSNNQCQIILGDVKLSGTKSQEHTCNLSVYSDNTCPRNASGRLPDSIQLDKNDSCHNTNLDNMGKQLYKPKFRGCLNENEVQPLSSIPDSLGSPVFPAALGSSDEVHNSHPSSKLRVSIGQLRSNSLELKNSESEDTSPITGLVSECKNIWKGIKSPSPELVSQHINNLIVQNQAIVETHNPLWSVKFRRQSSLNSNPEIDSVSTSKSKKNIPKTVKASSNVQIIQDPSLYYEKDPKLNMGINSALSVIHVNRASKNISNATVSSFLPCGLTPVYVNNVNSLVQGYVGIDLSNKKNPVPEFIPDAIDQSKSFSVANISKSWCNKCGDISGNEKKNFHINYCLNQPLAYTNTELNVSGRNVQNVALNLHKNGDKRSLVGHFNSNKNDVNQDETSYLPPTKRQKITSFGSYSPKPLLPAQDANILQQSYNRYINIDHGGNSESSNLYGGQVRISGERGMKTISINPMKGSSPSLDLSIVSKQLQTQEVAELQIPTSVVVTIAKCGLNSGGTMVKIDKKSENYFSHTSSNSSNLGPKVDLPIGQEELSTRLQFDCRTESNGRSYPKLKFKSDSHIVTSKIDESSKTPTLISKNSISDSNQKSQDFSSHSLIQKISCKFNEAQRSGLSDTIGRKVPYVPGIPGPYSQAGVVFSPGLAQTKIGEVSSPKAPALNLHQKVVSDSNYKTSQNSRSESRIVLMQNKLNEKPVIKPSIEITCDNNEVSENKIDENFLLPTKRPNTLLLKPQPFVDKKSLIGSTLVSPDTPRPKKSCAQLFLNGSAYTYLNLKVSTKTFFCCIYRPQPMYLLQSTNPKLSMYSNWQICKTSQTLNLSPLEAMGLHVSGAYYDKTYTIAKPTEIELQLTDSGYLKKNILKSSTIAYSQSNLTNPSSESIPNSTENANEEKLVSKQEREVASEVKRIKIFEGGFKTYEDYTYVRGRGRGRYVCERCGIRCRKPSMLKKHIRTHTDLRPFACHHCSFRFKTKGNLTKHLKSKAHYKKCSELGIDPVPLVFDDNQTSPDESQDSSSLKGHPSSINTELDEEDEDDDDDEGDDCEDDDDDDDQEELDVEWDADKVFEDSNHSQSQPEDLSLGASAQSYKSVQSSLRFQSNSSMSGSSSSDDFSINENVPMDLTVKSTVSPFSGKSRPEMSICTNEDSSSCSSGASKDTSSNVLSLVTKSSDMLRTIYDTTNKISANNFTTLKPKSLDESNCDGPMLQNYLTECAVFDSARKRSQYLISTVQSTQPMVTTTTTTSSISTSIPITSSIRLDTESEQVPTSQTIIREESKADENKEIEKAESTSHNLPTNNPPSAKDNQSNILTSINSKLTKKTDSQPLPTPLSSADHSLSSAGSAIFAQSKPESSSVRRGTKSSAISFEAVHAIPSPPANLTVMNSCSGDSKTTFISPSGIIPTTTNNRNLSSEDGKCRCNVCHKEFSKQGQLRLHINIHYIERPHRCDACGISFRTNGHLQKHKRSVTHFNKVNMNMTFGTPSTANPRPFKCHDCKVAFRIYGHLAKHLRSKLHILKLECLGKLPFGIYADIERSGINLNEIDTSDCENSLESLQLMANVLYKKEPSKLLTWRNQLKNSGQSAGNEGGESRNRTESNSSTNSEDYPLLDEPDPLSAIPTNDADSVNEDDVEEMVAQDSTQTSTNSS